MGGEIPPLDVADIMGGGMPMEGGPVAGGPMGGEMPMSGMGGEPMTPPPDPNGENLPFNVRLQPDGSSVIETKTNPPIVIAVNQPPKLPKWMSPDGQQAK